MVFFVRFGVWDVELWVSDIGLRVLGRLKLHANTVLGLGVSGFGFRVLGFRSRPFRVLNLRFREKMAERFS